MVLNKNKTAERLLVIYSIPLNVKSFIAGPTFPNKRPIAHFKFRPEITGAFFEEVFN